MKIRYEKQPAAMDFDKWMDEHDLTLVIREGNEFIAGIKGASVVGRGETALFAVDDLVTTINRSRERHGLETVALKPLPGPLIFRAEMLEGS